MKRQLLFVMLFLTLAVPPAWADNVTVHGTIGMLQADLISRHTLEKVGVVNIWNTRDYFNIEVLPFSDRYLISQAFVYLSDQPAPPPVPEWYEERLAEYRALLELHPQDLILKEEYEALKLEYEGLLIAPNFGQWAYGEKFKKDGTDNYTLNIPLSEIEHLQWGQWGAPWVAQRLVQLAFRVQLKAIDGSVPASFDAWALNPNVPRELQLTSWCTNAFAFPYELQHPKHGMFVGPVNGLAYRTRTHEGTTGEAGGFWFFPGETVELFIGDVSIGSAPADQRISPLDIFPTRETTDPIVVNLARLLLSLDDDEDPKGPVEITASSALALHDAMTSAGLASLDFGAAEDMEALFTLLPAVADEDVASWIDQAIGSNLVRRNISKSPEYAVDKPKLDIMPVWVPARAANGDSATVEYKDAEGRLIETRYEAKPLFVTYTEKQKPNAAAGIWRSGSDIITAVSLDDGATWKRFNVSHMANKSSFTLATGERFPGDSRGPQQKIAGDKILISWTSAYARGGKPSFAIRTVEEGDDYPYDDAYAVNDVWGVRGKQGSVDYDEDKDVGDQGIGEIPYYALWTCRGVLVWEGNASQFPDRQIGDVVWFKPERLTSGRRDAFFVVSGSAKNVGFGVAWQEDPGGLLPGSCKGGGDGWSGATVHKKTDIWYSFIKYDDFDLIDENWDPALNGTDEQGESEPGVADEHGQQPEIANRPKWQVPFSLPVRISDNAVVNTDNLKVQLDPDTGLPVIGDDGGYIPLPGAEEEDYLATDHEGDGSCDDSDGGDGDGDGGHSGRGGGWGMARYAYKLPQLGILNMAPPSADAIWNEDVSGDYRPSTGLRWTRFTNKPGAVKTVAVTADGRPLDGDTGACRPHLMVMPGGWAILGYEETKGLGIPPEGEHGEDEDMARPEPDDKGKNVIYHSFKFNNPDLVSAGDILNLPALDDNGELIPIYYKDAAGESTGIFRQYKTENARRVRSIVQPKEWMTKYKSKSGTSLVVVYRQGREGNGKPSDVFAVRAVVPAEELVKDTPEWNKNPYRFELLERYDTGADTTDPAVMKGGRRHLNMSAATVESFDPVEMAGDNEGHTWNKVGKWKQFQNNIGDESFANPYSDAKAHRGFLRGDYFVFGYSFTPNWGRLGGDHMDFFVRRSFDGGKTFTTDPNGPQETVHTVIERDPETGEFQQKQYQYGRGEFEPGRNVSLLKGNKYTVTDPRLVPPMGPGVLNPTYPDDVEQDPKDPSNFTYYVAFGTAEVLHGLGEPLGVTDTEKEDIFYSRTTDGGSTWLQVPWVINPDSSSPDAGETVYRWPWLAQGTPHQGHAQIRMHPSGDRLYAIWHQWLDGTPDEGVASPHDMGNDIWFRRIDFMEAPVEEPAP